MTHASGTFDVKITPVASDEVVEGAALGRMSLDKQFRGDIEGTGKGEMLTAGTQVKGSAAYSAIERIVGTLHGRPGTFALQHTGIMNRNVPQLTITVVPDSGTGELVGLSGTMMLDRSGGGHAYTLDYTLP